MTGEPRILIVDDEPDVRRSIASELRAHGYATSEAADGSEGLAAAASTRPDLILSDLAMPVMDGFGLIAELRKTTAVPIVVLSVRGAESERVRALDLGADDFVAKPFSVAELLARVRAQLRRVGLASEHELRFPRLIVDFDRRRVTVDGREVRLTPIEFALLGLLAGRAGRVVTIHEIVGRVWKDAPATTADTVRVHVASLRRKIEPDASSPQFIITEPWVGYRFIAEPLDA